MMRVATLFCAIICLAIPRSGRDQRFAKYKALSVYAAGSGILVLPRYSSDGQLCEVTLEKQHYSGDAVDLSSSLPHDRVMEVVNAVAPASERGKITTPFGAEYMSKYDGVGVTTFAEYEAVSIQIYGRTAPASEAGDIAVRIQWKKRACAWAEPGHPKSSDR